MDMNELADRMARHLGLALLAVFRFLLTVFAIWCLWEVWVCVAPTMFEDAPAWLLAPKFVPFAVGALFSLLVMDGLRK